MIVNECIGKCIMLYDGILIYMKALMYMSPYDSKYKYMKVYECKW